MRRAPTRLRCSSPLRAALTRAPPPPPLSRSTLLYGGVFLYPATAAAPTGKLRLLYECAPMALLLEAAGGGAVAGGAVVARILDIVPASPHAKSAIILGCARDVARLQALAAEDATAAASGGA